MKLIVTGASGQLGKLVVARLLDQVPAADLILVTRTPQALEQAARRGAQVRFGDFEQPGSLPAAFGGAGGGRALIISTLGARDTAAAHIAAIEAAARAGVAHIAYTSITDPVPGNPCQPVPSHLASEAALRRAGVPWTILRNALYSDLRAKMARAYIRDGRWTTNMGGGAHAFVSRADCAAAAAGALTAGGHEGQVYDVTGPELIDAPRYLAYLRDLGRDLGAGPVELAGTGDAEYERYRAAFMANPGNAGYFELFTTTGTALRTGYLRQLGTGVQQLAGRAPQRLEEVSPR